MIASTRRRTTRQRNSDQVVEYFVGIEDHYAWANLVSIATLGPDECLLDRRRVELLDRSLAASPYHGATLRMPPLAAEMLVREVQASATNRANASLSSLLTDLAPARCRGIAIRVPPLPQLPVSVAEAHANPWVMNRADGMIYHQALVDAAARFNLQVFYFEKATALALAARARGTTAINLERRLKRLGTVHGPPWRKGHIVACAAAILAHAS